MRSGGGGGGGGGGGAAKNDDAAKVMGPLFPRLHVNDTIKGGPRAPPRNKMALYEQLSVPSHRFNPAATPPPLPWQPHRAAVPSTAQVGGNDRPLFPSFCVPSNEPLRSSEHINTSSNRQAGNDARAKSGRQSTQPKSKDTRAAGSIAECSSQRRDTNIQNSSRKKLPNDDDFTVPSVLCSGMPPHPSQQKVRAQEKFTPLPTSPFKSAPTVSNPSAKYPNTDKRNLEGTNCSDTRSMDFSIMKDKEPAKTITNLEVEERRSSFQISKEKLGTTNAKVSSYRDRLTSLNVSDSRRSGAEGYQARSRLENATKTQNSPKALNGPFSTDIEFNGASNILERALTKTGEKRQRPTGHHDVDQMDDLSDSSVESQPGLEISPDDVVSAIGPKHFWKARRAIVNQQRVFAVQVFELHRLIKVQKLIAASPHLLIEGDPCLGNALVNSKKRLAEGNVEKQLPSAKNKDDVQPTLQQAEYSKDTEGNQPSPSQDDLVEAPHNNQATTDGPVSSNPPTTHAAPDNKQNNWCIPPPQNQWLVPVMSPSEGLVYKPYTGPCPPAGSFLAPVYTGCNPVSVPSTAGDFMSSAYGIPMPHQPQHMGVPGPPPPMPPMYFPPFSMPVMNPVVSASAVEQVSHFMAASRPNGHIEQHSRTSCNVSHMRSEALSTGIWRFHASRESELQGSSASSPFDRQQGEGMAPAALFPPSSAGGSAQPQPSAGSKENPARVIRVVPHNSRTASESAARIFRSIQMERKHNDS